MIKGEKLDLIKAKEKMKEFSHLLNNPDVKCLYLSPKDMPASADFLSECWNNPSVTPNMFTQALKDGYFDKYLIANDDLDVFVWTNNVAQLFVNGNCIPVRVDQYRGIH